MNQPEPSTTPRTAASGSAAAPFAHRLRDRVTLLVTAIVVCALGALVADCAPGERELWICRGKWGEVRASPGSDGMSRYWFDADPSDGIVEIDAAPTLAERLVPGPFRLGRKRRLLPYALTGDHVDARGGTWERAIRSSSAGSGTAPTDAVPPR